MRMLYGISVVSQCGATAELSALPVAGGPRQQGNGRPEKRPRTSMLNDHSLVAKRSRLRRRGKAAAALTPLIALGQCNLEGTTTDTQRPPWFHAGTDRLLSGELAYEFDRRARCSAVSREIPSFCILAMRVVRFRPSLEAAPLFPPITQFVSRRVPMMWSLSASARVRTLSV